MRDTTLTRAQRRWSHDPYAPFVVRPAMRTLYHQRDARVGMGLFAALSAAATAAVLIWR